MINTGTSWGPSRKQHTQRTQFWSPEGKQRLHQQSYTELDFICVINTTNNTSNPDGMYEPTIKFHFF